MRRHGIWALAGRRFRPCTTDSRHDLPIAPNLLKQAFSAAMRNTMWLADITYLPTEEGWLYLAAASRHAEDRRPAAACWPRFLWTWIHGLADR
jgi:transposase InsO family protein